MAVTGRDGDDPRERDGDLPHDPADARIAALYRQASGEEPPARLDRAIQAASRPVRTQSERAAPWWLPWRAPFAVAALAVVSVSLVTLMMEKEPERTATLQDALPPPPARSEMAAPPEARDAVRESPAAATPSAKTEERQRLQERSRAEPLARRADAPPAPAEMDKDQRIAAAPAAPARDQSATAAPQQAFESARSAAQAAGPRAAETQPAPPPAATPSAAPSRGFSDDAARASASQAPRMEARSAETEGNVGGLAKAAPAGRSPAASPETSRLAAASRPAELKRHIAELDRAPPAAWIERIVALRKEGRTGEADALLEEFRRRYPNVVLPPELQ